MVDMNTLISLQSTIFLLILAGYIMTRAGILPVSARGALSDLVIDFIMPCNIIVSFLIDLDRENPGVLSDRVCSLCLHPDRCRTGRRQTVSRDR